jgi:hypothetical protein
MASSAGFLVEIACIQRMRNNGFSKIQHNPSSAGISTPAIDEFLDFSRFFQLEMVVKEVRLTCSHAVTHDLS